LPDEVVSFNLNLDMPRLWDTLVTSITVDEGWINDFSAYLSALDLFVTDNANDCYTPWILIALDFELTMSRRIPRRNKDFAKPASVGEKGRNLSFIFRAISSCIIDGTRPPLVIAPRCRLLECIGIPLSGGLVARPIFQSLEPLVRLVNLWAIQVTNRLKRPRISSSARGTRSYTFDSSPFAWVPPCVDSFFLEDSKFLDVSSRGSRLNCLTWLFATRSVSSISLFVESPLAVYH
jgi:hypothetical protein